MVFCKRDNIKTKSSETEKFILYLLDTDGRSRLISITMITLSITVIDIGSLILEHSKGVESLRLEFCTLFTNSFCLRFSALPCQSSIVDFPVILLKSSKISKPRDRYRGCIENSHWNVLISYRDCSVVCYLTLYNNSTATFEMFSLRSLGCSPSERKNLRTNHCANIQESIMHYRKLKKRKQKEK